MYVVIGYNAAIGEHFTTAYNGDDSGTAVYPTLEEASFMAKQKTRNATNKHVTFCVHELWDNKKEN